MPEDLETDSRNQKAVLWPALGYDKFGKLVVDNPVSLDPANGSGVRWNTVRKERLDPKGNTITIDAVVVVNRKIANGSCMFLGSISDWVGTGTGTGSGVGTEAEVMQVYEYHETPDIKGGDPLAVRRTVDLMRFRGKPPTLGQS